MVEPPRRCPASQRPARRLADDAAGAQALTALRLEGAFLGAGAADAGFEAVAVATEFTATAFLAWVDGVLEQVSFPATADEAARVVITPLARALLRPFHAVVCPGADAAHLGAGAAPEPLLGDALAVTLGLTGTAARREAERLAFAQLARVSALDPALPTRRRHRADDRQSAAAALATGGGTAWSAR